MVDSPLINKVDLVYVFLREGVLVTVSKVENLMVGIIARKTSFQRVGLCFQGKVGSLTQR